MSQRRDAGTLKKKKNINYRSNSTIIGCLIVSHCIYALYLQYNNNIYIYIYIYSYKPILNIQVLRDAGTLPKTQNQACKWNFKFLKLAHSFILIEHKIS